MRTQLRPTPRAACAGVTLVELLVAAAIMAIVVGIPARLLTGSQDAINSSRLRTEQDELARRAVQHIAERLETTGATHFTQPAGGVTLGTSAVTFRPIVNWVGAVPVEGTPENFTLVMDTGETNDGTDEDGDGLIDERRLQWTTDPGGANPRVRVLCSWVADSLEGEIAGNGLDDNGNGLIDEEGLVFVSNGDGLEIQLTLERRERTGALITTTARRFIAFRN